MSIPPMLTEAARDSRLPVQKRKKRRSANASNVLHRLERHILLDGFRVVIDLEKSCGSYLYDAATGHRLIDLYGFFGSWPGGFNNPYFNNPDVQQDLLRAAKVKVANSDVYSQAYAEFVETFARVAGLRPLNKFLFIEGGAIAV